MISKEELSQLLAVMAVTQGELAAAKVRFYIDELEQELETWKHALSDFNALSEEADKMIVRLAKALTRIKRKADDPWARQHADKALSIFSDND